MTATGAKFEIHDRVQWTTVTGKLKHGTITSLTRSEPWIYVVLDDETFTSLGVCEFQLSPYEGTTTLRAHARRTLEDRLIEAIDCFDCGAERGMRCRDPWLRERTRCCQVREDFGAPIAYQMYRMTALLDEFGLVP